MAGDLLISPAQYEAFERARLANTDARYTAILRGLSPDKNEITAFVNTLFKYADNDTYVSLRAFHGDNEPWRPGWGNVKLNGRGFSELIDTATKLAGTCAKSKKKVVFCPPIATFRTERNARGVNLACGLVLTVECDKAAEAARERLEGILGPETVVVASGGLWVDPDTGEISDRLHLHWRLREPTRDKVAHAQLKEARRIAAQLVGADLTAVNPVHPLRWPGSWHRKEAPRLAQIVALNNEAEIDLGDALAWLREAAALEGISPRSDAHPNPDATADIRDIVAALAVIPNDDLPWAKWNRYGMVTWRSSGGSEEGREAFHEWSAKSNKKYDYVETDDRWDHYLISPPTEIGAASLFYEARKIDPRFVKPSDADSLDEVFGKTDDELPTKKPDRPPLAYFDGDTVELDKTDDDLIDGVLSRNSLAMVYGDSTVGKTFFMLRLAYCLGSKSDFFGRLTTCKGAVLYVAAESGERLRNRVIAIRDSFPIKRIPVRVITSKVNLYADPVDLERIIDAARVTERDFGVPVIAIIIDTLARAAPGMNENTSEDMGLAIGRLDRLREETGAAVILVHHSGKDQTKGARGWSGLHAAVDHEIEITRDGDIRYANLGSKQRDGPDGNLVTFALQVVELFKRSDGRVATTCIVEEKNTDAPSPKSGKKKVGIPPPAKAALDILNDLLTNGDVNREQWREACAASPKVCAKPNRKTKWSAFDRAYEHLARENLVFLNGDKIERHPEPGL